MIAIPAMIDDGEQYDVFLLLDSESIQRIQQRDPAELITGHLPDRFRSLKLRNVIITFYEPEEVDKIMNLFKTGNLSEALKFVTRGWKYRPESGDSDDPFQHILNN